MFEWSDSMSVGNATMDMEHRNLLGMVATVEHALRSGDCTILSQAFQRLFLCVDMHQSNEERFACALGIEFDEHRMRHRAQQFELMHLHKELEAKSGIWSEGAVEHFSKSLWNWARAHIAHDDSLLKPGLSGHPYHFKP